MMISPLKLVDEILEEARKAAEMYDLVWDAKRFFFKNGWKC